MFDLASVQTALRELGRGRLAALRLPRPQRPGPPRRSPCRPTPSCRAAGSTTSRPQGEPRKLLHRIEPHALDHLPGGAAALPALAGTGGRRRGPDGRRPPRGDGVRAAQRQPLRLPRGRRHRRAGALQRRRGRAVRRPDPAIRGLLGRRPVGDAPRSGEAHAAPPTTPPSPSSPSASAATARCARPRCSSASSTTSRNMTSSPTTRRSSASARTAATRTTPPPPAPAIRR